MINPADFWGAIRNFGQQSAWQWVTSGSATVEFGVGKFISAGGEGGYFHVTSTRHEADVYTCEYAVGTASIGIGGSLFGPVTVSGAPQEMPAWGTRFARLLGAPDSTGETGDPTGFLGQCLMFSGSVGFGNTAGLTFIFLGYNTALATGLRLIPGVQPEFNPVCYKYGGISWGFGFSSAASAGMTGKLGAVGRIRNMSRQGTPDVRHGGTTLRTPLAQ